MNKLLLASPAGYTVPCLYEFPAESRQVVLACHGFGSAKDSSTNMALAQALSALDIGFISFDLAGHGESPDDGLGLRIANCLDDFAATEAFAKASLPQAEICYFGSSFGAYLLCLYLSLRPHAGCRAMLRCAAVTMPELFEAKSDPADIALMGSQGWCWIKGYDRPFRLSQGFRDDLQAHDLFRLYRQEGLELLMIHGDADDTVPLADAQRFAGQFGVPLIVVPGADHRFQEPGQTEQVVAAAVRCFTQP